MVWLSALQLKSKSPEARRKAIESLTSFDDPRTLERLAACLGDEDPTVRCAAVKAMEEAGPDQPNEHFYQCLRDADGHVRAAAAAALGRRGGSEAMAGVALLLGDPHADVRSAAACSLRQLGWKPAPGEEQALLEIAIGNPRGAVFLGGSAVAPLVEQLKHDTGVLRRAAAEALETIADERAVIPLLDAARDPDPNVR